MRSILIFSLFVAFASAYVITYPTSADGWTTAGPQKVSWNMGGNDPDNFTIVLVNDQMEYKQELNAMVDGTLLTIFVNPPATGWPFGPGFHIDFAADSENLDSVLAKSDDFSFKEPGATSSSTTNSTSTTTSETTSYSYPPTTTRVAPTVLSSTTSSTASVNTTSTSAASAVSKSTVLIVLSALVAVAL